MRRHFRDWHYRDIGIPNAFALPSGDIILTDKFVELSQSQQEIDSVLLHEMGHVVERHSLEIIIESTILATAVMVLTGDSSTIADMGIGIGSLLVTTNYIRAHEAEADEFAFKTMLRAGIDPQAFSQIMQRITAYDLNTQDRKTKSQQQNKKSNRKLSDYLATHPSTEQRIKEAQRYSDCFKKGLSVCE